MRAYHDHEPLEVRGAGTRRFLGRGPVGSPLMMAEHTGILEYEATEFVMRVRSGTPMAAIDTLLASQQQVVVTEIPRYAEGSTIGGAIAAGLTGPARPFLGALRDAVLGVTILTGTGQVLSFGGRVLKNVAGFDVSRLMVGALGTLGVLLDVTLRLGVRPECEQVRCFDIDWTGARALLAQCEGAFPVTAALYRNSTLSIRLSGLTELVEEAGRQLGGESGDLTACTAVRDLTDPFFRRPGVLWRLLVPPDTPIEPADLLVDWAGAQRYWVTADPASLVHQLAARHGGQAMRLWGGDRTEGAWAVPPPALMALMGRVKLALDPRLILNRGRLYEAW